MKHIYSVCFSLLLVLFLVPSVLAVEFKQGETVTVSKDQSIGSTLVAGGNSVVIDGVVHGDVFCAGKKVTIAGTVDGDVLCAAQELTVTGTVSGNLRTAGQAIVLTGRVGRNANLAGQSVSINPEARVAGEVIVASQMFKQNGIIGPLTGWADTMSVAGEIKGDTNMYASVIQLEKTSVLRGSFVYTSEKEAGIASGSAVAGQITRAIPEKGEKKNKKPAENVQKTMRSWPANALGGVFFYLLLSFLVSALFPKKVGDVAHIYHTHSMAAALVGTVSLVAVPFLVVSLLVTIVGILLIPIPIVLAFVFAAFGRIVGAQVFGKSVLEGFGSKNADNLYLQSLVGVPILWCMFKAPYIGGLFAFISIILGLGTVLLTFQKNKK